MSPGEVKRETILSHLNLLSLTDIHYRGQGRSPSSKSLRISLDLPLSFFPSFYPLLFRIIITLYVIRPFPTVVVLIYGP